MAGKEKQCAACYLRLSKEDLEQIKKGDESESIKNQRALLLEEAEKRDLIVKKIYVDEDYSGTDPRRPGFCQLLQAAERREFQVILCKSQSRFTRDIEMAERCLHQLFPRWGIRFISVVDHVDTAESGNKKLRQLHALLNEWYVEDLSENIRAVYRNKMRQGQYLGAIPLYGYQKKEQNHHQLVIDAEVAAVVQKIFRYCVAGMGASRICRCLEEEGILTPRAYQQKKERACSVALGEEGGERELCRWNPATVKRILKNEMYIGTLVQGREQRISYKSHRQRGLPEKEWVRVPEHHDAIVSQELFDLAQESLEKRRKRKREQTE